MFILHGELTRIPPSKVPIVRDDAAEDESEQPAKPKLPPQKPDSFGQLVAVSLPFSGIVSEDHNDRNITNKLLRAGFTQEEVSNLPTDTCSTNGCTLSDYSDSRYVLVRDISQNYRPATTQAEKQAKRENTARFAALIGAPELAHQLDENIESHELAEELRRAAEQSDLETRELMKAFVVLSLATSNPKGALVALGNLLGSVQTAAAKQFIGSEISEVAAFAAKWALKQAKLHPEEAGELAAILSAISVNSCGRCEGSDGLTGHCEDVHADGNVISGAGHQHVESPGIGNTLTGADEEHVLVYDKEQGEFVDGFVFDPFYEDSCEETCEANERAIDEVTTTAVDYAGLEKEAYAIYEDAQAERDKVADAQVQVDKVRNRITNASYANNKRLLRELTAEERALNKTIFDNA